MLKCQLEYDCENIIQPQDSYEHGVYEEAIFHAAIEGHNDGCGYGEYGEGQFDLSGSTVKEGMC